MLINKGWYKFRKLNLCLKVKNRSSFQTIHRANRHQLNLSWAAHMAECETVMIFNFDAVIFQRCYTVWILCDWITTIWAKHFSRNSRFFPRDPGRECINHHSLPSKWRQRATAGGEELGFKQYRLQEVQPSLLVVDSDINSNEYLGALPDCLSMNCYHTWGRALEAVLFVSFCVLLTMCEGLCVTACTCNVGTSVYFYVLLHCCECVPL